jgi:hypothetical protein
MSWVPRFGQVASLALQLAPLCEAAAEVVLREDFGSLVGMLDISKCYKA